MADTSTRLFRASLRAHLCRDVELASSRSIEDLAATIVAASGFYGDLTGRYHDATKRYDLFADMGDADAGVKSVRRTKLSTAFPEVGKEMLFLFDHGDAWPFKVKLAGWGKNSQRLATPRRQAGRRSTAAIAGLRRRGGMRAMPGRYARSCSWLDAERLVPEVRAWAFADARGGGRSNR